MSQRIAVVTGGIGGLGTAICLHLARSGAHVIAADLAGRSERIAAFKTETAAFAEHIAFEPVDVTDDASCADLARRVG